MLRPVEHGVLRSVVVGHPNLPSSYAFTKPLMIPIANISMTNQAPKSLHPASEFEANMVFSQGLSRGNSCGQAVHKVGGMDRGSGDGLEIVHGLAVRGGVVDFVPGALADAAAELGIRSTQHPSARTFHSPKLMDFPWLFSTSTNLPDSGPGGPSNTISTKSTSIVVSFGWVQWDSSCVMPILSVRVSNR